MEPIGKLMVLLIYLITRKPDPDPNPNQSKAAHLGVDSLSILFSHCFFLYRSPFFPRVLKVVFEKDLDPWVENGHGSHPKKGMWWF